MTRRGGVPLTRPHYRCRAVSGYSCGSDDAHPHRTCATLSLFVLIYAVWVVYRQSPGSRSTDYQPCTNADPPVGQRAQTSSRPIRTQNLLLGTLDGYRGRLLNERIQVSGVFDQCALQFKVFIFARGY
jgi:hypothetical protein